MPHGTCVTMATMSTTHKQPQRDPLHPLRAQLSRRAFNVVGPGARAISLKTSNVLPLLPSSCLLLLLLLAGAAFISGERRGDSFSWARRWVCVRVRSCVTSGRRPLSRCYSPPARLPALERRRRRSLESGAVQSLAVAWNSALTHAVINYSAAHRHRLSWRPGETVGCSGSDVDAMSRTGQQ